MNHNRVGRLICCLLTTVTGGAALAAPSALGNHRPSAKYVAYDAKDRKYYSVEYARAHQMHDRGGDKLIIIPRSKLPKGAKLSHAMHGVEP